MLCISVQNVSAKDIISIWVRNLKSYHLLESLYVLITGSYASMCVLKLTLLRRSGNTFQLKRSKLRNITYVSC